MKKDCRSLVFHAAAEITVPPTVNLKILISNFLTFCLTGNAPLILMVRPEEPRNQDNPGFLS